MPRYRYQNYKGEKITTDPNPREDGEFNKVTRYPQRIQKVLSDYSAKVQKIGYDTRMSIRVFTPQAIEEAKQRQAQKIREARQETADALRTLKAEFDKDVASAKADMRVYLEPDKPKDSNEALLREMQEQRAWNRAKGILDNAKDSSALLGAFQSLSADLAKSGDETALWAFRTELPAYLTARGQDTTSYLTLLDQAESQAEPWKATVFAAEKEMDKGAYQLGLGFTYGIYALENGQSDFMMPAFNQADGITTVAIDEGKQFTG